MTINERLAKVRKSTKLTQVAFAKKLEVSRAAYLSYELGERDMPTSLILKLWEGWSINPTWLLTGRGAQTPELYSQFIADAVIAVRSFMNLKDLEILPEDEAKLVALLAEYFGQGGEPNSPIVEKMLEVGT